MPLTSSSIGVHIRLLRQQRKLSLAEVSRRAGYSKGFLSKIERAKASPPIATLLRLAGALGVEPSELFETVANPKRKAVAGALLVKASQRVRVPNTGSGPGYEFMALAAQRGSKRMEPFFLTVKAADVDPTRMFEHPGEEFIFVLEGEMDYRWGDQLFPMRAGDSLYFDGTWPHVPLPRTGQVTFVAVFSQPGRNPRARPHAREADDHVAQAIALRYDTNVSY